MKNGEEASLKQLIDVVKREQAATEVTYQQLETGVISPLQKKKYRQLEQRGSAEEMTMSAGQVSINEIPLMWLDFSFK